jgi:predicted alpha/beta superfamily hydrolase
MISNSAATVSAMLILVSTLVAATQVFGDEIRHEIMSGELNELREISVVLPQEYLDQPNASYPVLYVLDGIEQMPHTVGTATALHTYGEMPALIIVGVDSTDRTLDMTPTVLPGVENSGGADKFLDFLVDELKPYIAERYRTNNYSMLAGHSFGGLLVTYSLIARPEEYQARFAFSPSLRFLGSELVKQLKARITAGMDRSFFYMNVGGEQQRVLDAFHSTRTTLSGASQDLAWKAVELPDETHFTTPVIGQFQVFRELFRDWKLSLEISRNGVPAVTEFYKSLSARLGYEIVPEENAVNTAAAEVLDVLGSSALAKELFELSEKNYPESPNVYAGLARVARVEGDLSGAIQYMQKALSLVDENDVRYARFADQLSRFQDSLSGEN